MPRGKSTARASVGSPCRPRAARFSLAPQKPGNPDRGGNPLIHNYPRIKASADAVVDATGLRIFRQRKRIRSLPSLCCPLRSHLSRSKTNDLAQFRRPNSHSRLESKVHSRKLIRSHCGISISHRASPLLLVSIERNEGTGVRRLRFHADVSFSRQ